MKREINSEHVAEVINSIKREFFTVIFTKRTTGEVRKMTCRKGVKKHLKDGKAAYNFSEKNLISVYDMRKQGYRCIPIENVLEIRASGKSYKVIG